MINDVRNFFKEIYDKAKLKMGNELATWNKIFQFEIFDGDPFYIEFSKGSLKIEKGIHQSPIATLSMSKDILMKILNKELDPITAFIRGMIKISGNILEVANIRRMLEAAKGE